jgi:hypothetical protein
MAPRGKFPLARATIGSLAFLAAVLLVSAVHNWIFYKRALGHAQPDSDPSSIAAGALLSFAHFVYFGIIYTGVHLATSLALAWLAREMPLRGWVYASTLAGVAASLGFVAFNNLLAARVITANTSFSTVLNIIGLCVVGLTAAAIFFFRSRVPSRRKAV